MRKSVAGILLAFLCNPANLYAGQVNLKSRLDAAFNPFVDAGAFPGAVVAVITKDGTKVISYGKMANGDARAPGQAPGPTTLFGIASVTKIFTGIALADLVREGKISVHDPAEKHLPAGTRLPMKGGRKILVVHLANHTSGYPGGTIADGKHLGLLTPRLWWMAFKHFVWYRGEGMLAGITWDDLLAVYSTYPINSTPGETWSYSNIGMGMLGHILERLDGRSFEELVVDRICKPLKLRNTRETPAKREKRPPHSIYLGPLVAAGGLYSNVDDLVRLLKAGMGRTRTPLAETLKFSLRIHHRTANGKPYALGWAHDAKKGTYFHQGGDHAFIGFNRSNRTGAVILLTASNKSVAGLGHATLDLLAGRKANFPKPRIVVDLNDEQLSRFAGVYKLDDGKPVTITHNGDTLVAHFQKGGTAILWPESDTSFFCKEWDCNVTFKVDEKWNVTGATVKMYNWSGKYTRSEPQ